MLPKYKAYFPPSHFTFTFFAVCQIFGIHYDNTQSAVSTFTKTIKATTTILPAWAAASATMQASATENILI
jgi:hypothetical protein